ncbi:unnamed protein product [Eruca vesicaria subsp. sativa]|uniref:Profilin n=1 Tax=Eruca vesicaria subsp. sativa TaxID=29727 RepID=A0ABC8L7A7_ERUVS|nr:unnamed protein product [Eruca vesicaria subsp. sativa]
MFVLIEDNNSVVMIVFRHGPQMSNKVYFRTTLFPRHLHNIPITTEEKRKHTKMSWQSYVDDTLMSDLGNGRCLTAAAILDFSGDVLAQSANFPQLKPEEIDSINKGFAEPETLAETGLFINEEKYMVTPEEAGDVIQAKKGAGGVTIKKTVTALIFGIYEEPVTPRQCTIIVENLGNYLADSGY